MRLLLISVLAFGTGIGCARAADDCPSAKTANKGFVVERGSSQKTEVLHSGPAETRTILRHNGNTILEATLYQGLFELDRLDRGKRSAFRPIGDLAKIFPLTPGKKVAAVFEQTEGERKGELRTYSLEVRKETDTLSLGSCKYKILKVQRSRLDDKSKPVFMYTDYYAPDLKLILAKEYRERDGSTELIKFDKISPTAR